MTKGISSGRFKKPLIIVLKKMTIYKTKCPFSFMYCKEGLTVIALGRSSVWH